MPEKGIQTVLTGSDLRRSGLIALRGCRLSTLRRLLEIPILCRYPILQAAKLSCMGCDRSIGHPQATLIIVTQGTKPAELMLDRGLEASYLGLSSFVGT
ncbi:hypothetical protein L916_21706 [Phytophthora nicotianae]|uniref:Uncharacterized protein n=1 Tax=Phytophthora nicotianae TaxID=4792 RepID=W2HR06_PHYNI|nr:hypothetical protein L916_21706 [Phytophthora nicotianae]